MTLVLGVKVAEELERVITVTSNEGFACSAARRKGPRWPEP